MHPVKNGEITAPCRSRGLPVGRRALPPAALLPQPRLCLVAGRPGQVGRDQDNPQEEGRCFRRQRLRWRADRGLPSSWQHGHHGSANIRASSRLSSLCVWSVSFTSDPPHRGDRFVCQPEKMSRTYDRRAPEAAAQFGASEAGPPRARGESCLVRTCRWQRASRRVEGANPHKGNAQIVPTFGAFRCVWVPIQGVDRRIPPPTEFANFGLNFLCLGGYTQRWRCGRVVEGAPLLRE